jgi:hypothetical protein
MDNPAKGQSRMDNPEMPAILGTQDTGRRQAKQLNNSKNQKDDQHRPPPQKTFGMNPGPRKY